MNGLVLVPKRIYDTKMSRIRFESADALQRAHPQVVLHTTGPGWPDWPEGVAPLDWIREIHAQTDPNPITRFQFILNYMVEGLQGSPIPVVVVFHETYDHFKTLHTIRESGARLVVFTYANDQDKYQPHLNREGIDLVQVPHGVDGTVYKDYGLPKDIDVLIAGNLSRDFYPFRARLAHLARREIRKRGYTVTELPHPGFTLPVRPGTAVGEAYARMLNRAKLVVTCTSRERYAFAKLAEIPLCGSLPLSDLPKERRGFYRKTMLNVESWMTDREILYRVEEVLDDEALRRHLTTIARDKVTERLEIRYWAERFLYHLRRLIIKEDPPLPQPLLGDDDAE